MTFLCFAYGSNMLPARLLGRCPSGKLVGTGVARAWSLAFSKASKDGSGKATLVTAPNSAVPGVIFEIDLAEREQLDRHEALAAYCRERGLYPEQIAAWRLACEQANDRAQESAVEQARLSRGDRKRVRELERELTRKEKALAETAALLTLRKKRRRSGGEDA